ncbi:MAG TPA: formyltransferase family protein [Dehalococcoidia bacterium]
MTLRIGWFSTGRGPGSRALLTAAVEAIRSGTLPAEIAFVFSHRERGEHEGSDQFFDLVESYGLPLITFSDRKFRRQAGGQVARLGQPLPAWRTDYDRRVAELVAPYRFDLGILAGYMLIFTAPMCNRYPLLNLHPAAPGGPKGIWQEVIWELIRQRAAVSGVYTHLSIEEVDEGPVVTYCTYPLRGPDFDALWREIEGRTVEELRASPGEALPLFQEIRRHGAAREQPLIIETIRAFAEGRVRLEGRTVVDREGRPVSGYDLTPEIDRAVGALRAGEAPVQGRRP